MVRVGIRKATGSSDPPACRERWSRARRRLRARGRRRASRAPDASAAVSASGRRSRARAAYTAARISSNMSNDGVDAGLSVAMQTRIPAARSSETGAMPQPSSAFERGQCATATSCAASSSISSASACTQCAASTCGPSSPASASARIPVVPSGSTRSSEIALHGPVPAQQPLGLGGALRQVRRDREPEPGGGAVEVEPGRVRGVRRDAEAARRPRTRSRRGLGSARTARGRRRRPRTPRGRRCPGARAPRTRSRRSR